MVSSIFLVSLAFAQLSFMVMTEPASRLGDAARSFGTKFPKFDLVGFTKSLNQKPMIATLCMKQRTCMTEVANLMWEEGFGFKYNQRPTVEEFNKAVDEYANKKHKLPGRREVVADGLKSMFKPLDGHISMTRFRDQLYAVKFNSKKAEENLGKLIESPNEFVSAVKQSYSEGSCPIKKGKDDEPVAINGFQLPKCEEMDQFFASVEGTPEVQHAQLHKRTFGLQEGMAVVGFFEIVLGLIIIGVTQGIATPGVVSLILTGLLLMVPLITAAIFDRHIARV